ncbi:lipocalin family protein [Dokdonella sp.]|uniref:lipocalin family protein n=1 Tax=Dokdonella sp. TaxID=2291710 RepID=UPI002F3F9DEC
MSMRPLLVAAIAGASVFTLTAASCSRGTPMPSVGHVDLSRFMGDWYVIAHIPSRPERNAWNAVESYRLADDGTVGTTFRYRSGRADAPLETMHARGYVRPGTGNAVWGMQFIWPIRAEYVVAYLDADYRETIIARSARDYAWIMARTPTIPESDYRRLVSQLQSLGYATDALRRVPQQWPEAVSTSSAPAAGD